MINKTIIMSNTFDSLPVLVVIAHTQAAADEILSEMIDRDVTAEVRPAGHASAHRVWRLVNKYYSADVRCVSLAADAPLAAPPGPVGALVQLLASHELAEEAARARLDAALAHFGAPDVGLVLCHTRSTPHALLELCARRRLQPVPLDERAEDAEDEAEPRGLQAVRAAVHAHTWAGLRRAARGEDETQQEEAVESAELFAAALGALGEEARRARALGGAARLDAAERLVAAFAAALPDDWD